MKSKIDYKTFVQVFLGKSLKQSVGFLFILRAHQSVSQLLRVATHVSRENRHM